MDSLTSVFCYHLLNKLPELRSLTRTLLNQNLHIGFHVFLEKLALQDSKAAPCRCLHHVFYELRGGGAKGAGVGAVGSVSGETVRLFCWEHTSFEWGVPREGHSRRHGTMVSGSCRFGKEPKEQSRLLG